MTLEEFVKQGFATIEASDESDRPEFWLWAFVKLVRERAEKKVRGRQGLSPYALAYMQGAAFKEVVRELRLEEPEP